MYVKKTVFEKRMKIENMFHIKKIENIFVLKSRLVRNVCTFKLFNLYIKWLKIIKINLK